MRRTWSFLPLLLLLVVFFGGIVLGQRLRFSMPWTDDRPQELSAVWEAWDILRRESLFKNQLDPERASQEAIRGLLKATDDPYASLLASEQYQQELQDLKGEFEGIGVEVGRRDSSLVVIAPISGAPADLAGIRAGDVILAVDGESTEGWNLRQATRSIRGPKGTTVELLVRHQDGSEPALVPVVRDVVVVETVTLKMLEEGVAYLRLSYFAENSDEALREKLAQAAAQGAQGLVLDLRGNPGGLVSTVINIASEFLSDGVVFYEVDGDGRRQEHPVQPGGVATEVAMAVLVNQGSASASEILAGALQARQRATLIGARTFGKGSVNLLRSLKRGPGLVYSTASWLTPDDRRIEGQGLIPDIVVEQSPDAPEDLQLQRALEELRPLVTARLTP